jgi:aspartate aminotransferase
VQAEALLPAPAWVSYAPILQLAGAKIVELPTTPASGFKITPSQLKAAITPHSRVLVLNSPCNPTSQMYSPEELTDLARVIVASASLAPNLVVITDEIYEKIVHAGVRHASIASLPGMAERTITINGTSKAFAMTGWRVGYAAASGEFGRALIRAFDTLQGQMTNNITSFIYPAIVTALTQCADDVEGMRAAFGSRAELIHARLGEIEGLPCVRPMGAFYAFPDVSAYFGRTSKGRRRINSACDFAEALLDEHQMAVVPGEEFGGCGGNHVRLSFACSEADIEEGAKRLRAFVAGLTR